MVLFLASIKFRWCSAKRSTLPTVRHQELQIGDSKSFSSSWCWLLLCIRLHQTYHHPLFYLRRIKVVYKSVYFFYVFFFVICLPSLPSKTSFVKSTFLHVCFFCLFFLFTEEGKRRGKGTQRREEQKEWELEMTLKQIPTVTLLSELALAVSSPGSLLLLPLYCPAHTVLLRSPDSLMLLCEFSSPLFLDPLWLREERRGEKREE